MRNLAFRDLRFPRLGAMRGGTSIAELINSLGGALFTFDAGQVYQDRSVTPSTPASVGDPVGTVVGLDGTWFAIASADGTRATLRETSDGRRYLEGTRSANRYNVQDAAANPLTPDGVLHTSFFGGWGFPANNAYGPFAWGSAVFENSYIGNQIGGAFSPEVRNTAGAAIRLGRYIPHNQNSVFTLRHQNNPTLRVDGANEWPDKTTGDVRTLDVGQFAFGTRDNNNQAEGAARHYFYAFIPSILSDEQCATIEAALYRYVRQPETPASTAEVDLDFAGGQFSWGGVSRTLGDLTDNLDGSYTLGYTDWGAPGYLISIDFNVPDWTLHTAGQRIMRVERDNTTNLLNREAFFYLAPSNNIHYKISDVASGDAAGQRIFGIGAGTGDVQEGLQRATLWVRPDEVSRFQLNGHVWQDSVFRALWKKNPDGLTVWEDFTSGNVLRLRAMGGTFSEAEADAFHKASDFGEPIHMIGDSFVVFGEGSQAALQRVTADALGFIFVSGDGVGGATLPQHRDRFLAYTGSNASRYDSTLVIEDGGWGQTDNAADIAAIQDMVDALTHTRWIYLEPWYDSSQGSATAAGINFRAGQAVISAAFPNNWVETTRHAQAAHNDTATSLADVAAGLIPMGETGNNDMRVDSVHPTSPRGYTLRNRVTLAALARRGYITGLTLAAPSAPTNFAESSLALSWDLPADEGNDPVYEFTVSRETAAGSGVFTNVYTGQLRRHTLTGLTTGTWAVRVTATNETGTGPAAEIDVVVA